jgi:hypothetical protein
MHARQRSSAWHGRSVLKLKKRRVARVPWQLFVAGQSLAEVEQSAVAATPFFVEPFTTLGGDGIQHALCVSHAGAIEGQFKQAVRILAQPVQKAVVIVLHHHVHVLAVHEREPERLTEDQRVDVLGQ